MKSAWDQAKSFITARLKGSRVGWWESGDPPAEVLRLIEAVEDLRPYLKLSVPSEEKIKSALSKWAAITAATATIEGAESVSLILTPVGFMISHDAVGDGLIPYRDILFADVVVEYDDDAPRADLVSGLRAWADQIEQMTVAEGA